MSEPCLIQECQESNSNAGSGCCSIAEVIASASLMKSGRWSSPRRTRGRCHSCTYPVCVPAKKIVLALDFTAASQGELILKGGDQANVLMSPSWSVDGLAEWQDRPSLGDVHRDHKCFPHLQATPASPMSEQRRDRTVVLRGRVGPVLRRDDTHGGVRDERTSR